MSVLFILAVKDTPFIRTCGAPLNQEEGRATATPKRASLVPSPSVCPVLTEENTVNDISSVAVTFEDGIEYECLPKRVVSGSIFVGNYVKVLYKDLRSPFGATVKEVNYSTNRRTSM